MSDQPDFFARTERLQGKQPQRLRPPASKEEHGVKEPAPIPAPVFAPTPGWKSGWRLLAERLGYAPTDEATNPQPPPRNP
jgi:hypothetical protein